MGEGIINDTLSNHHCFIPLCQNRSSSTQNLSIHTFLKDLLLKKKWIATIKQYKAPEFSTSTDCIEHFVESDHGVGK